MNQKKGNAAVVPSARAKTVLVVQAAGVRLGNKMTEINVDASRIKTIRKARKIGRPKLAKLTGLTERQIAKIETSRSSFVDGMVLHRLSAVLQVPAPTLTGEFAVSAEDL